MLPLFNNSSLHLLCLFQPHFQPGRIANDLFIRCVIVLYCYFNITLYLEWFRTRTSGNTNPMIFSRMGGYLFVFLCKFWFYRWPSPTCPADRQPLSREKVFNHASCVRGSRKLLHSMYVCIFGRTRSTLNIVTSSIHNIIPLLALRAGRRGL